LWNNPSRYYTHSSGILLILIVRRIASRRVEPRNNQIGGHWGSKGLRTHRNYCVGTQSDLGYDRTRRCVDKIQMPVTLITCCSGFNYQFNALEPQGKPSELNQAFTEVFHSPNVRIGLAFRSAQAMFPFLRFLVNRTPRIQPNR
jgi:hypothetical protein